MSNNLRKRLLLILFLEEGITTTKARSKSASPCSRNFKEDTSMAVVVRGRTGDDVRVRGVGEQIT